MPRQFKGPPNWTSAMSVAIVYETHSTTVDNERGIATGWLPGELSALGRIQARALGERRSRDGLHAVFTSDLSRAVQTARIASFPSALPIFEDPRLRECNYGELTGRPVAEVAACRLECVRIPFPKGESYSDVVNRTRDFLADLAKGWGGKRVLLIAHSASRWALDHLLNGDRLEDLVVGSFAWREGWEYELPTG